MLKNFVDILLDIFTYSFIELDNALWVDTTGNRLEF